MFNLPLFAMISLQDGGAQAAYTTFILVSSILGFVAFVLTAAGLWKTLKKAGEPGWPALIPLLNWYYMVKISGRPGWHFLLFFVPILNIVIWVMVALDIGYAFGKTTRYGVFIFFLPWLMFLLLGFGDSKYYGSNPV